MKKINLLILFLTLFNLAFSLQSGDKLQVLYRRVWAYENPKKLNTRLGPYSDRQQMEFVEQSKEHKGYLIVTTPDSKTAFIKADLLASNKNYTRSHLERDRDAGKLTWNQYERYSFLDDLKLSTGQIWLFIGILLVVLIAIWKFFPAIDRLFIKMSSKKPQPIRKPRFILYSILPGIVIGSFLSLFASDKTEWFLNEGLRIWAIYPGIIEWILWACFAIFLINFIAKIAGSFLRFSTVPAIFYAVISAVLMIGYFAAGILSGGLVVIVAVIFLASKGSGTSSGSGSTPGNSSDSAIYDPSKSVRWNEKHAPRG